MIMWNKNKSRWGQNIFFEFVCCMVFSTCMLNSLKQMYHSFSSSTFSHCYCFFSLQALFSPCPHLPLHQLDPVGSSCVCFHTCTPFYPHRSRYGNTQTDSCTSKIISLSAFMVIICCWEQRRGRENQSQAALLCCGANLDDWPWNTSQNGLPCVPLKWPVPSSVM